jgi:hypothetical protein
MPRLSGVPNVQEPAWDGVADGLRRVRVGEQVGCEQLGASLYELEPGQSMVFRRYGNRSRSGGMTRSRAVPFPAGTS